MEQTLKNIQQFIYEINPTYLNIAAIVLKLIIVVLFGLFIYKLMTSETVKQKYNMAILNSKEVILKNMNATKIKAFNYNEIENYINRVGLVYMTNGKMTPVSYMLLKIFLALFFMFIGLQANVILGLGFLLIGYVGLDLILNLSDKTDNDAMLEDIKNVYDTLRIQTKAGVYITSVITDCYLVAQNKRLKTAFLNLTSDIIAKNDLETSLEEFRSKFNNEYINTLVIIINQSLQTGQAAKMFDDIREQIKDIEAAMMISEKTRIQQWIIFVQILLYGAIILTSVYVAIINLGNGLSF